MPRHYLPKVNKFVTLAASILIALSAGSSYLYPLWSTLLKRNYGLNQRTVGTIGAAHNFGAYSSFISGILYDALERRQHVGPRLTLFIGCCVNAVGFFCLWGIVTKSLFEASHVWQLVAVAILAGNGGTWFDTSPLSTNLRNFPAERGFVVGIIKSCVGLSASLYTEAYEGVFGSDPGNFLLFLSWAPSLVVLILIPCVNYVPWVQESERSDAETRMRFLGALGIIGSLAVYLTVAALVGTRDDVSSSYRIMWITVGSIVMLLPVVGIAYNSGGLYAQKLVYTRDEEEEEEEEEEVIVEEHEEEQQRELLYPSYSLKDCFTFKTINFWILACVCAIGIASGLSFINSSSQMVYSFGGSPVMKTVIVTFFGVASCAGRMFFGAISEHALHAYGFNRCNFLLLASCGSFLTYVVLGLATYSSTGLYPVALLSGFWFGGHWSLLPSLASELFGLDSFASIYTVLQLFPAVTAYTFAGYVGSVYDATGKQHGDPKHLCIGPDCFQESFLGISALCGFASVLALVLKLKTQGLYVSLRNSLHAFEMDTLHAPLRHSN